MAGFKGSGVAINASFQSAILGIGVPLVVAQLKVNSRSDWLSKRGYLAWNCTCA